MMMTIDKWHDKENVDSTNMMLQRWFRSQHKSGISSVKLSEAKDQFPTITMVALERLFETLIADGILVLDGNSRIKHFKIMNDNIKISEVCSNSALKNTSTVIIPKKKEANYPHVVAVISGDRNKTKKTFITTNATVVSQTTNQRHYDNNNTMPVPEVQKLKHQLSPQALQTVAPLSSQQHENSNSFMPTMTTIYTHTYTSPLPLPLPLQSYNACAAVPDEALAIVRMLLRNSFQSTCSGSSVQDGSASVRDVSAHAVATSGGNVTAEGALQALEYLAQLNKIMIVDDEIVEI